MVRLFEVVFCVSRVIKFGGGDARPWLKQSIAIVPDRCQALFLCPQGQAQSFAAHSP